MAAAQGSVVASSSPSSLFSALDSGRRKSGKALHKGEVLKRRDVMKTYVPRLFALTPVKLVYYLPDNLRQPKGVMMLDAVSGVYRSAPDAHAALYPFSVVGRETTYHLACRKRQDTDEWVKAIKDALQAARGHVDETTRDRTAAFATMRAQAQGARNQFVNTVLQAFRIIKHSQQERHGSIPWQVDVTSACGVCRRQLSKHGITAARRHHCRLCGRATCAECASVMYDTARGDKFPWKEARRPDLLPSNKPTMFRAKTGAAQSLVIRACRLCDAALCLHYQTFHFALAAQHAHEHPAAKLSRAMHETRAEIEATMQRIDGMFTSRRLGSTWDKIAEFEAVRDHVKALETRIRDTLPKALRAIPNTCHSQLVVSRNLLRTLTRLAQATLPVMRVRRRMVENKIRMFNLLAERREATGEIDVNRVTALHRQRVPAKSAAASAGGAGGAGAGAGAVGGGGGGDGSEDRAQEGGDDELRGDFEMTDAEVEEMERRQDALRCITTVYTLLHRMAMELMLLDHKVPSFTFRSLGKQFHAALDIVKAEVEMCALALDEDADAHMEGIKKVVRTWDVDIIQVDTTSVPPESMHGAIVQATLRTLRRAIIHPLAARTAEGELQPAKSALRALHLAIQSSSGEPSSPSPSV